MRLPPEGALTQEQLRELRSKRLSERPRIFFVGKKDYEVVASPPKALHLNATPPGYYFFNYWLAYGYSVQVKQAFEDAQLKAQE